MGHGAEQLEASNLKTSYPSFNSSDPFIIAITVASYFNSEKSPVVPSLKASSCSCQINLYAFG